MLAMPEELVKTVAVEKVAPWPPPKELNVTSTLFTRLLYWSLAVICRGVAKAVPTVADCGLPPVVVMLEAKAGFTVMLFDVPVMLETVSVAVTVSVPAVFSVTMNVPTPELRPEFDGSTACPSLLVICTIPA